MAMNLNLTLVVQMVHFMLAYVFLAKFLLKPGYDAVKSDAERVRQLTALIVGEQEKLAEKQEYQRRRWQVCQNYFHQNRPDLETQEFGVKSFKLIEPLPTMTTNELEAKALEIGSKLKKKVLYD
jgi:hypothetical protein